MPRHRHGWVCLHRSLAEHAIGRDATSLGLWCTLLMWAAWKESTSIKRGRVVTVHRGQVVASCKNLADHLDIDESTVRRRLKWFEKQGAISMKVTNWGTTITIVNYSKYQDLKPKSDELDPGLDEQLDPGLDEQLDPHIVTTGNTGKPPSKPRTPKRARGSSGNLSLPERLLGAALRGKLHELAPQDADAVRAGYGSLERFAEEMRRIRTDEEVRDSDACSLAQIAKRLRMTHDAGAPVAEEPVA